MARIKIRVPRGSAGVRRTWQLGRLGPDLLIWSQAQHPTPISDKKHRTAPQSWKLLRWGAAEGPSREASIG